jgi:hypothetical protein
MKMKPIPFLTMFSQSWTIDLARKGGDPNLSIYLEYHKHVYKCIVRERERVWLLKMKNKALEDGATSRRRKFGNCFI